MNRVLIIDDEIRIRRDRAGVCPARLERIARLLVDSSQLEPRRGEVRKRGDLATVGEPDARLSGKSGSR